MEKQEYGQLSAFFYELTKPVGYSIEGDIEYYSRQLAGILGRVLEAGVGTGRMLIPLESLWMGSILRPKCSNDAKSIWKSIKCRPFFMNRT